MEAGTQEGDVAVGLVAPAASALRQADSRGLRYVLVHNGADDGEPDAGRVDVVRVAVRDRALVPERGPAAPQRIEERVVAADIEDRVLLAGEARLGEILRGRRGAHRDCRRAERAVAVADRGRDAVGDVHAKEPLACPPEARLYPHCAPAPRPAAVDMPRPPP